MIKRFFDLIVSFIAIFLLFPLVFLVFLASRLLLGPNVLFFQERPGFKGRPFKLIKFKTMTNERDAGGNLLSDKERITKFGKLLRSSSIDELPSLWNVLKGDMSLIGPRPLLVEYLPLYSTKQARRHEVRPGITGWAQVNGRNAIAWEEKFKLDVWYVDNRSFRLDIYILLLTIKKVCIRENINSEGHATTYPFRGNKNER